jgi:5'-3' exonuclease
MSKRHWPIASVGGKSNQVKIFISPSNVHGEGEVKLIDWLVRGHDSTKTKPFVKMGDSVAIVGGDSDLVL